MHLVNARTIQLEHFTSEKDVEYVTLSHRWETEEISYQELQSGENLERKKGYLKILGCCAETKRRGYQYAWIDTCCIDKTSSTELSEAINSMYRWYQNSKECYAYLPDVSLKKPKVWQQFHSSEWFERGWTLQELIAPRKVFFFDKAWRHIGSKRSLVKEVNKATGITEYALTGQDVQSFPIAERLHWAAHRRTTRLEDRAYSLMGLFNVSMPMLYGEGGKAFLRLQQEIIQRSNDDSIFAWSGVSDQGGGLLAPRLDCFARPMSLLSKPQHTSRYAESVAAYNMSNMGLNITISLTPWISDIYVALLNCECINKGRIGIFLRRLSGNQYRRVRFPRNNDIMLDTRYLCDEEDREWRLLNIYVQQDEMHFHILKSVTFPPLPIYGIQLTSGSSPDWRRYGSFKGSWEPETNIARLTPGQFGEVARFDLTKIHPWFRSHIIRVGLTYEFRPVCEIRKVHLEHGSRSVKGLVLEEMEDTEGGYFGDSTNVTDVPFGGAKGKLFTLSLGENTEASFRIHSSFQHGLIGSYYRHMENFSNRTLCKIKISSTCVNSRFIWAIHLTSDERELDYTSKLLSKRDPHLVPVLVVAFMSCYTLWYVKTMWGIGTRERKRRIRREGREYDDDDDSDLPPKSYGI